MKSRKYIELLWDCLYVYWDIINSNGVTSTCITIMVCVLTIWSQIKFTVNPVTTIQVPSQFPITGGDPN